MILHINNSLTWRGGEQQLLYLSVGLQKQNIAQIIIGKKGSELEKKCIENNIDFCPMKLYNEFDLISAHKIADISRKHSPSLIHAHTATAHSIGLFAKMFEKKLKLVVSRRVDFSIKKNFLSKKKYYSNWNDVFLTVSDTIRKILIRDGVNPNKIRTVHSGIDLDRFVQLPDCTYLRKEFNLTNEVIIGNVAALVDHKDQKSLIRAITKIKSEQNYKIFIVGAGELEQELKQLAEELHVSDKIVFTGFRKDVLAFYKLFDIFTLTSKEEGLGTSVLDAMASGLSVVATKGGGIPEMLDTKGALLAEIGDFITLGDYYTKLLDDEEKRKSMGEYNKISVQKFSIEETINKTINVYIELLEGKI